MYNFILIYLWYNMQSGNFPHGTVERLTQIVESTSAMPPSLHFGPSDHLFHAQRVRTRELDFILATFNVLAQQWVWYQSGKKPDGSPTPSWYNLDGQQGLENTELANEKNAELRENEIVRIICEFLEVQTGNNVFLCLQECSPELRKRIVDNLGDEYNTSLLEGNAPGCVIVSNMPFKDILVTPLTRLVRVDLAETEWVAIACAHLDFNTEKNKAEFKWLKEQVKDQPLFVAGDYNIPCMPISESAKNDGSTQTLSEFINFYLCGELGWKYSIAQHWRGYTNFNCRKNCADPTRNADHFDNILFLHCGGHVVDFTPQFFQDLKIWWKKE